MKKLLLATLLLIFSCDEVLDSVIIEGCTTATACNYDSTATKDDGSCVAPEGCNEWCEGDAMDIQELDCNSVCGGNAVEDCAGVCGGDAVVDDCGVCDNDSTNDNDTCKDCLGIPFGENNFDICGICDANSVNDNECFDCNQQVNGTAYIDNCGGCVGGNTEESACEIDCNNEWGGTAIIDSCGICSSGTTELEFNYLMDECGICNGEGVQAGFITINGGCYWEEDIQVLQLLIDNNIQAFTIDLYDDNDNGIIDLLELGGQEWEDGRLTYFNCSGLTGEIPDEIGTLTQLRHLSMTNGWMSSPGEDIEHPSLTGEIPTSILNLTNLIYLSFSFNGLTGSIPVNIGYLEKLETLFLTFSGLSGNIPNSIGNLQNLTILGLGGNFLDGELPESILDLTNLKSLRLFGNQLTGEIPSNICQLTIPGFFFFNNYFCPPYPSCIEDYVGEQDTSECEYCIENPTDPLCN